MHCQNCQTPNSSNYFKCKTCGLTNEQSEYAAREFVQNYTGPVKIRIPDGLVVEGEVTRSDHNFPTVSAHVHGVHISAEYHPATIKCAVDHDTALRIS